MAAQTQTQVSSQRDELVDKIERERISTFEVNNALVMYNRYILQDLPFDGTPSLLSSGHTDALDILINKSFRYEITILRIVGYASQVGETTDNLSLSLQRAQAVNDYIEDVFINHPAKYGQLTIASPKIVGKGESDLPVPSDAFIDNPRNRRVEIVYRLVYHYPISPDNSQATSKFWKIDFGPAASAGGIPLGAFSVGGAVGAGSLTMLPDPDTNQTSSITRSMKFDQLGISVGFLGQIKKLKFLQKIPGFKRLLKLLDSSPKGNYKKTEAVLANIGFSVDIISTGGEFMTSQALTFDEMRGMHFATFSGSVSILGKGEGSLIVLYSDYFLTGTVIFGFGQNITVPDLELQFVPLGWIFLGSGS